MKIGDLVRRKFMTMTSMEKYQNPLEPGLVIEETAGACKVIFPSLGSPRSFLKNSMEIINENR